MKLKKTKERSKAMMSKINETLSEYWKYLSPERFPKRFSYAAFPSFDIPSEQWSFLNRIICG